MIAKTIASPDDRTARAADPAPVKCDRWVIIVALLALAILVGRGFLIANAHSEDMDAEYHLRRGYASLMGNPYHAILARNDGPLGQMLLVLPMVASHCDPGDPIHPQSWSPEVSVPGQGARTPAEARELRGLRSSFLYGYAERPEILLRRIVLWEALLFVPVVVIAFAWARALYGLAGGWLAAVLILVDPNIAAHVAAVALDAMGAGAIFIACFAYWYHARRGTRLSFVMTALATAGALLIKHTAIVLPPIFLVTYLMGRTGTLRQRLNRLAVWAMLTFAFLWALTLFDVSSPMSAVPGVLSGKSHSFLGDVFYSFLERRWPAGVYWGCLVGGFTTNAAGHSGFLWGTVSKSGWWYYFPVIATYKVPFGIAAVILAGLLSMAWRRPARDEVMFLLAPAAVLLALLMASRLNFGIRHFLPAYLPLLVVASRVITGAGRAATALIWAAVAAGAGHALTYHPDYIAYLNRSIPKPQAVINDTNLDWGQGFKEARAWVDAHPDDGRPISAMIRWADDGVGAWYYLGPRVHVLSRSDAPPTSGLLILSPVMEAGMFDDIDRYGFLRAEQPVAVIGHYLSVYDLDAIKKEHSDGK